MLIVYHVYDWTMSQSCHKNSVLVISSTSLLLWFILLRYHLCYCDLHDCVYIGCLTVYIVRLCRQLSRWSSIKKWFSDNSRWHIQYRRFTVLWLWRQGTIRKKTADKTILDYSWHLRCVDIYVCVTSSWRRRVMINLSRFMDCFVVKIQYKCWIESYFNRKLWP